MILESFNLGWRSIPNESLITLKRSEGIPVTLPYDSMLDHERSPEAPSKGNTGFFPDILCTLVKRFSVPREWVDRCILFEFEGVYTNSMVYINGDFAGGCPHGYTQFHIDASRFLRYGAENEIKVIARTHQDSRWYTGAGIYRNVNLLMGNLIHIAPNSYRVTATEIDELGAVIEVQSTMKNMTHSTRTVRIETELLDAEGCQVAHGDEIVTLFPDDTQTLRQRLYLRGAHRWRLDKPHLYRAKTRVYDGEALLDSDESAFGVRNLALDPTNGLRLNGEPIKLRGACVHHDNGVIGAAAIPRAEERRVQLLKQAGFNAVRSAHNPISRAFLDACDKYGMLVMDELTDMWLRRKTDYDYATCFRHHWADAVEAMVAKDYNHPSVIMYSIGNEIPEVGTPHGASIGRQLAQKVRSLDCTRYTINSVNLMLSAINALDIPVDSGDGAAETGINELMTSLGGDLGKLTDSEQATTCTEEDLAAVDIAGYNYATNRYEPDRLRFPNRVICGSETFPKQIAKNWRIIQRNSHVIGDFTWTGWDYLGEAGIGKTRYACDQKLDGLYGDYPSYIAYCGDIDIIGNRRPISFYREIVFGLRLEPYLAVRYPWTYGKERLPCNWDFVDGISSWTWTGWEAKPVQIEVYAPGDSVELLLNGQTVGEEPLTDCKAVLEACYQPGKLEAIAKQDGNEIGRTSLSTADDDLSISLEPDRTVIRADDTDLCYIMISLRDNRGTIHTMADRPIHVQIHGSGELLGLGSANPDSEERFRSDRFSTFHGQMLTIVRPNGPGEITITAAAADCPLQSVTITAS